MTPILFPQNSLDPGSQPWARKVEDTLRSLDSASGAQKTLSTNTNAGVAASLTRLSDQIRVTNGLVTDLQSTVNRLDTVVAESQIVFRDRYINAYSFPFTNTNYVTRGSVEMPIPVGAKFVLLTGNVSLRASSSTNPAYTQTINHRMNISYPSSFGGTNDLVLNEFSSLLMPTNSGLPMYVASGGPIAGVINTPAPGSITFNYQTMAQFSGYVGDGEVTANIFGLFFYRTPGS